MFLISFIPSLDYFFFSFLFIFMPIFMPSLNIFLQSTLSDFKVTLIQILQAKNPSYIHFLPRVLNNPLNNFKTPNQFSFPTHQLPSQSHHITILPPQDLLYKYLLYGPVPVDLYVRKPERRWWLAPEQNTSMGPTGASVSFTTEWSNLFIHTWTNNAQEGKYR